MASNDKKRGVQRSQEIDGAIAPRAERGACPSGIPSEAEYERQALARVHKRLEEIQRSPLAFRKKTQASFLESMRKAPEIVAERVGWLLDGHYGYGSMMLAKRILGSPRMNRGAALSQLIGALEWQCPEILSRVAWKTLTTGEKARLESVVQAVLASALSVE